MSHRLSTLMNAVPRLVLASPAHRLMSSRYATATRLNHDDSVEALRGLVKVPGYTKAAGISRTDGEVAETDLVRAANERIVLAIDLGAPS